MTRTVTFFLPPLSWHPVSGSFKQFIAESFAQPTHFLNFRRRLFARRPAPPYISPHPWTICNVSKSGSALHALTNSEVAERILSFGLRRYPVSVSLMVPGSGKIMVSSVSLGQTATNPEVRDSEPPPTSGGPKVPNHLLDGLAHETRGIVNRLTFESWLDARESRILSEGISVVISLTTQAKSSAQ